MDKQSITRGREDFLEAVLMLSKRKPRVKSIEIANILGISKPAVSRQIADLIAKGLIVKEGPTNICLTEAGLGLAEKVLEKHETLKAFLLKLGVSYDAADIDCCKIEHVISDETFSKIKEFLNGKE